MRKRMLAALLALMMLISLMPMTVLAEGETGTEQTPVPTETTTTTPAQDVVEPTPTPAQDVTEPTPTSAQDVTEPTPTSAQDATEPTSTPAQDAVEPTPTPAQDATEPTPTSAQDATEPTPTPTQDATEPTPTPTQDVADSTPTPSEGQVPVTSVNDDELVYYLYARWAFGDKADSAQYVSSPFYITLGTNSPLIFSYGTSIETAVDVAFSELICDNDVAYFEGNNLSVKKAGTGTITYKDCTFSVEAVDVTMLYAKENGNNQTELTVEEGTNKFVNLYSGNPYADTGTELTGDVSSSGTTTFAYSNEQSAWEIGMAANTTATLSYGDLTLTVHGVAEGEDSSGSDGSGDPMGPGVPEDFYGIYATWLSPNHDFAGIETTLPVGGLQPVQLWLGNPSDQENAIQLSGELTVVGNSAEVNYNKNGAMDGVSYEHTYDILTIGEGESYISYVHEGTEYQYNITGYIQMFDPVDALIAKQVSGEAASYTSALEIPCDTANNSVGSVPVTFCFGLEEDGKNVEVNWTNLTTSGVVQIKDDNADGFGCIVTATEPGHGTVTYTHTDGKTYGMLVTVYDAEGGTGVKDKYLYAIFPGDTYNRIYSFELTPDSMAPFEMFFFDGTNHIQLKEELQTTGVAVARFHEELNLGPDTFENVYEFTVSSLGSGAVIYTYEGVDYVFPLNGTNVMNEGDLSPHYVSFEYDEETIDIGIGQINQQVMMLTGGTGMAYDVDQVEDFLGEFVLVALVNSDGMNGEDMAPKAVFDAISNVKFELIEGINEDGTIHPLNCSIGETTPYPVLGVDTWKATVTAKHAKGFNAKIQMSFTIDLDGEGGADPETYTVTSEVSYSQNLEQNYAVPVDGTEKMPDGTPVTLNWILESTEHLEAWMEGFYPEQYGALVNSTSPGIISLVLPAVTYGEVIESHLTDTYGSVQLLGSDSGETVMPGFVNYSGLAGVENIVFDGSVTGSNGIGVLAQGDKAYSHLSDLAWVMSCTFKNLDKAIVSTEDGFVGGVFGNKFYRCGTGIYIDCDGEGRDGWANDKFRNNSFYYCGVAVHIVELPAFVTPYSLRITDSSFIHNGVDFRVQQRGRYYFYRNFYGWYMGRSTEGTATARTVIFDTTDHEVVTNPRRATEYGTALTVDPADGLYTMILEDMASELVMDGALLQQNTDNGETTEITLLDKEQNEAAVWTFGGEEG